MYVKYTFLLLTISVLLLACGSSATPPPPETTEMDTEKYARVPTSWVTERVAKAKEQLEKTEAGQIIWRAMEAHGGLANWYSNGPLSFQFDYEPRGEGESRNTVEQVDTWRNLTRHQATNDSSAQYGWGAEGPWITKKDTATFKYNTRFWSLTPIYFLGQPFIFDGEGVQLEKLPVKELDGKTYDAVKVSFAAGTGDAPDDYYIAYFDQQTGQQEVIRYIVSYPGYFEKGKHLPEKIMTLHDKTTVGGITFPTAYKTYWLTEDEQRGEYITDIAVTKIKFMPDLERAHFKQPANAVALTEL